jgi:putative membrane protein
MEIPPETGEAQSARSLSDDLAIKRTELAAQRTVMASERTFSAWIRTGLAAVAAGLGIGRLLAITEAGWLATLTGAILILTGATIYVVAYVRFRQGVLQLQREGVRMGRGWVQWLLVAVLMLSALLALLLLF